LQQFPDLELPAEKDIEDLKKADAFTKAFACIQSSWLIIQCIARVSAGLPTTQLELATIAFVVCALIMYMLWWNKPFGVEPRRTIVAIMNQDSRKSKLVKALAKRIEPRTRYSTPTLEGYIREELDLAEQIREDHVSDFRRRGRSIMLRSGIAARDRKDHIPNLTYDLSF
jgi:hypothetical protein